MKTTQKINEVEENHPRFLDNISFGGGAVKGLAHVGVLEALKKNGLLPRIRRASGTSIGAFIAAIFAIGYDPGYMKEIILKENLFHFFDMSGGYILKFITTLLKKKSLDENLTFGQLHELGQKNQLFKDLYVTGVTIKNKKIKLRIFSHETDPSMSIAYAVRISMAIPLLFVPGYYNGRLYWDGGIRLNLPIRIFDDEKYLNGFTLINGINMRTLGISLTNEEGAAWARKDYRIKKPGLFSVLENNAIPFQMRPHSFDSLRTLYIPTQVSSLDITISPTKMEQEIHNAFLVADNYLQTYYVGVKDPHTLRNTQRSRL